jgi:hypothetical protein
VKTALLGYMSYIHTTCMHTYMLYMYIFFLGKRVPFLTPKCHLGARPSRRWQRVRQLYAVIICPSVEPQFVYI